MPVSGVGSGGAGYDAAPTMRSSTQTVDFFKLITEQLKYQDPMNPQSQGEFLGQMAQFETLSKMQDLAKNTASMLSSLEFTQASALIGKTVTWNEQDASNAVVPQSGAVQSVSFQDGKATLQISPDKKIEIGRVTKVA